MDIDAPAALLFFPDPLTAPKRAIMLVGPAIARHAHALKDARSKGRRMVQYGVLPREQKSDAKGKGSKGGVARISRMLRAVEADSSKMGAKAEMWKRYAAAASSSSSDEDSTKGEAKREWIRLVRDMRYGALGLGRRHSA